MNGRALNGFDAGRLPLLVPTQAPKGPVLVDSYRQDAMNNFRRDKPRVNPMNPNRMQSSVLVDLKDPVQVHLLTETAIFDSNEFEILSQEEVDDLKKQVQVLNQRIEQTRANLVIQSKYRDAAISMSKLYSPTGKRRSLLGSRGSGGDAAREAEAERDAIQKKCEELASELWSLEKRVMEPRRRLLEHTAGILQMTHKVTKQPTTPTPKTPLVNGVPASPESMYATSNGRDSLEVDDVLFFDEGSQYRSFEDTAGFGRPKQRDIDNPLKSPVLEQNKQLVEETERLREENNQLRQEAESLKTQSQSLSSELDSLRNQSSSQWKLVADAEQKLQVFNNQLREIIVSADPAKDGQIKPPPSGQAEPGDMMSSHLEYLEKAILAVGDNKGANFDVTAKISALNVQIQDILLLNGNTSHPGPPDLKAEIYDQLAYLEDSMNVIGMALGRAVELSNASSSSKQQGEQAEAVLMGLWEIIQSSLADMRQRKQERKKTRLEQGLEEDDEDLSDSDSFDPDEKYSLQAFSTKVQWLYGQATSLKEQKTVLKRQIKQQRELNSKSDGEKEQALNAKEVELEQARTDLNMATKEADELRSQLSKTLSNLESAQDVAKKSGIEQSVAVREVQDQLKERNAKIASLEAGSKDVETRLAAAETSIATITAQLKEANDAKSAADKVVEEKTKELKAKEDELEEMTGMMAEFKMEAMMAKAELDGAYGSRKERAAEAAALANTGESAKLQAKVDELQPRVEELEKELRATAKDLQDITKQAIDAESKIADLESELDSVSQAARKEKESLQEALDAERFKANNPASPSGRGNTSILTESYREALRTERKKHDEQLRNEQMTRRRLEDELRALKRAQGPGKSPLSPR